jgi:succinate dehydrogenase hydrophobic anchor subunit
MAVTALVFGIIGVILGLIPILAVPTLICGILALTFGGVGLRAVLKDPRRSGKGMAIAGIALGATAFILAIVGFVIVANAFN